MWGPCGYARERPGEGLGGYARHREEGPAQVGMQDPGKRDQVGVQDPGKRDQVGMQDLGKRDQVGMQDP